MVGNGGDGEIRILFMDDIADDLYKNGHAMEVLVLLMRFGE